MPHHGFVLTQLLHTEVPVLTASCLESAAASTGGRTDAQGLPSRVFEQIPAIGLAASENQLLRQTVCGQPPLDGVNTEERLPLS